MAKNPAAVAGKPPPASSLGAKPSLAERERRECQLARDEHWCHRNEKSSRVGGEHEDETIALEEVVLRRIPAKLVVVIDVRLGRDDDAQATKPCSPRQLEVLLVHEELRGETAQLPKELRANGERCAARIGNVVELRQTLGGLLIAASPRKPGQVHDVAARVEQLRPVE